MSIMRRWKGAVKTLVSTAELVRNSETLADQDAAPAERCEASRSKLRTAL